MLLCICCPCRDQKMTVRMTDGSVMTLPPPSFVATALERLGLGPSKSFLDVGAGGASGWVVQAQPPWAPDMAMCLSSPWAAA